MLTDDAITTMLHDAYTDAVADLHTAAPLATTVRRLHRTHRRRTIAAVVATPALAAAATVVALANTNAPSRPAPGAAQSAGTTSTRAQPPRPIAITLAGHILTAAAPGTPGLHLCGTAAQFLDVRQSGLRTVTTPDDPSCEVVLGTTTLRPTHGTPITLRSRVDNGTPQGSVVTQHGTVVDGPGNTRTIYVPLRPCPGIWVQIHLRNTTFDQPLQDAVFRSWIALPPDQHCVN